MADPVADYLATLNTSDRARASAWDAVYAVKDDAQAQQLLKALPFSDAVKATLWDARKGTAPAARQKDTTATVDQSQGPQGSAAGRYVSNLAEQLNPVTMAEGAYGALAPEFMGGNGYVNTAKAIVGQMGDQWSKANDARNQGRYSEMIGHAAAGSIPIVGPQAAAIGEQGASGDVAGMFGAATGLLAPFEAANVVKGAARGAGAIARTVAPGVADAAATALDSSAAKKLAGVMAPTVGANKTRFGRMAAEAAPEIVKADDMGALSRSGLHAKVLTAFESAKSALDDAADNRGISQTPTQPLLSKLQAARDALTANPVEADQVAPKSGYARAGDGTLTPTKEGVPLGKNVEPAPSGARIAAIDQVIKEVKQLGPVADYEALRRIRQAWDGVAKPVYSPSVTADFLKKQGEALGAADATAAIREHLAEMDPATAKANGDYHLYKTANDVMRATEEVEATRPKVGRVIAARVLTTLIGEHAAGLGGAVGGYALAPAFEAMSGSGVTSKIATARLMSKLAGAIRGGDVQAVTSLTGKLKGFAARVPARVGFSPAPVTASGAPPAMPGTTAQQ